MSLAELTTPHMQIICSYNPALIGRVRVLLGYAACVVSAASFQRAALSLWPVQMGGRGACPLGHTGSDADITVL